jgi:hypothetical protein
VKTLLQAGAHVEAAEVHGYTAPMLAAKSGHTLAALALVDGGANVDRTLPGGRSALTLAHKAGHSELVQAVWAHVLANAAAARPGADDAAGDQQHAAAVMEDLGPQDAGVMLPDSDAQLWEIPVPESGKKTL